MRVSSDADIPDDVDTLSNVGVGVHLRYAGAVASKVRARVSRGQLLKLCFEMLHIGRRALDDGAHIVPNNCSDCEASAKQADVLPEASPARETPPNSLRHGRPGD